ncbi:MAG: DEAD/DEAH box helicase, partial [Myxococcota bacterium]
ADGKKLGTLPRILPTLPRDLLIFAGHRWEVIAVDAVRHVLEVKPSKAGAAPDFGGSLAPLHDGVRQRMRAVYLASGVPAFCDDVAARLLADARAEFSRLRLRDTALVEEGADTLLFHWMGDRAAATLRLMLTRHDLRGIDEGICLRVVGTDRGRLAQVLSRIGHETPPLATDLASAVPLKRSEKYDGYLGEELLSFEYAHRTLDVQGALSIARFAASGRLD